MSRHHTAWQEIIKGTSLLWRKMIFFVFVGIALFGAGRFMGITLPQLRQSAPDTVAESTRVSASLQDNTSSTSTSSNTYQLEMRVGKGGELYVNNKKMSEEVEATADFDELRYIVLDGSTEQELTNAGFYDKAVITVELPAAINQTDLPENQRRLIGTHGATVKPSYFLDRQTLVFEAVDVSPTAILTVLVQFPRGYLSLGAASNIERRVLSVSGIAWLIASIVLLLITLLVFFYIYEKSTGGKNIKSPSYLLEQPPVMMSPALVGILMHGRIRPKEILAMVVDLAARGLLGLEDRDGELVIYKKQSRDQALWQSLQPYERSLIDEFFGQKSTLSTVEQFRERAGKELFSRRVTQIYGQLYQEATRLGLFAQNPARVHAKYKAYSLGLFTLGLAGFLYAIFAAPDPKFTLIFWAAMLGIALMSAFFAARISTRTLLGRQHLEKWLAFRNYLALGKPISLNVALGSQFDKYLPYAIAMDAELEWANRFAERDFHLPPWYGAAQEIYDIQGFADSFFPLLGRFSEQMAFLKEPILD
ncbi:MAG TPA: DUF2207 domain-containing protein [Patescibacteria group bacterium]|nr:DUF2207 domain-containing protein [Patescibacteria group bacterium]